MRKPDRRQSPRIVAGKILCIRIEPDNHAIVLNVSDGGLAFHSFTAVADTGTIRFSFSLLDHQRVQVTGELAWRDGTKKTAGLRFAPLPAATREQIREWALQAAVEAPSEVSATTAIRRPNDPLPDGGDDRPESSTSVAFQRFPYAMSLPHRMSLPPEPEISSSPLVDAAQAQQHRFDPLADPLAQADLRARFLRGFATGAVVSALATALVFFAYGRQINDTVAQFRGTVWPTPTQENRQVAAAASTTPTPAAFPVPAAAPPSTSAPDSDKVAGDTEPSSQTRASSGPSPDVAGSSRADLRRADGDSKRAAEPAASASSHSATLGSARVRDSGEKELAIAQEYLRKQGASASGAAVALLWSAVEKGNVGAEVTLAELYARGDGVPRSCDQARILLDAAASKGSDEADQQLAQIAGSRCD